MTKVIAPLASLIAKGKTKVIFDDFVNEFTFNDEIRLSESGEIRILEQGNARITENSVPYVGVYREQPTPSGRIIIREKYYTPTNPRTEPQQANRSKFATAVAEWENLSMEEQIYWNKLEYPRHMAGRNRFIANYMKTH